jgi:hypothetical protein
MISEEPEPPQASSSKVWAWPWVIMFVALYLFTLPWINYAIIKRYFTDTEWGAALPGLNRTPIMGFCMRAHMACGAVSILLGPLQLSSYIRRRFPWIHRWSGRLYVVCAMLSSVMGLMFIGLKGKLVGGYNMSLAFSTGGAAIGVLAFKTWQTARAAKTASPVRDFTSHRNWAIRSYSQILAPMLYRYWYVCLLLFDWYQGPALNKLGAMCKADDTCPDYYRWFDMVHCWTYWLSSWLVAEVIIHYLPPLEKHSYAESAIVVLEDTSFSAPLLERTVSQDTGSEPAVSSERNVMGVEDGEMLVASSPRVVNAIGIMCAVTAVVITGKLFTFSGDGRA